MILGVFYHAALMFNVDYDWMINFDTREWGLTKFSELTHLFRMEAFFVISAFLAAAVINKYGRAEFLKRRATRLFLPFVVGFIFVNLIVLPRIEGDALVGDHLFQMHHLWFLPVLFVAALIHQFFFKPEFLQRALPQRSALPTNAIVAIVFLFASIFIALLQFVSRKILPYASIAAYTDGFLDLNYYVHFLPFYFLGAVLYNYRAKLDDILKCWPVFIVLATTYLSHGYLQHKTWALYEASRCMVALSLIGLTLAIFRFIVPQTLARPWMSNYSYTMYLLHQPLLYLLRNPVMKLVKTSYTRFELIAVATVLICTVAHQVISRSATLSLLFNGELNSGEVTLKEASVA